MEAKQPVPPRLPPGFRFRPTDEELVVHYLRRRALASPLPAAVDIPDVRILAHDPSDLLPPGWSEQERYFFTCKEAKYVKGRRANRATGAGYWKATGKEKPVAVAVPAPRGSQAVLVGMKRSLVFYRGKPPSGIKTDWVMHEYRLAGAGLAPCRRAQGDHADATAAASAVSRPAEGWVLCRVFRKKGSASAAAAASSADRSDADAEAEERVAEDAQGARFIDFFARADHARRRRAASPVVSSSCLTDASHEQHCREQETTSRGA
ncbi:NAC domain-containing protein 83-like [Phragmites australis]|uniref:NAC domain-containing protein 83-like n=1 Tax=Phragmites australis TaxID=29695 RepID=UPI002D78F4CD|nr:NAC domain-containing protein 83-like [Phragmites australis]